MTNKLSAYCEQCKHEMSDGLGCIVCKTDYDKKFRKSKDDSSMIIVPMNYEKSDSNVPN